MLGKWLGKNRTTTGPATTDRAAPVSVPVDAAAVKQLRNRGLGLADRLSPLKRLLTGSAMG